MVRCCDTCTYYRWYYDYCEKYNCEVDGRSMCNSWRSEDEDTDLNGLDVWLNEDIDD